MRGAVPTMPGTLPLPAGTHDSLHVANIVIV